MCRREFDSSYPHQNTKNRHNYGGFLYFGAEQESAEALSWRNRSLIEYFSEYDEGKVQSGY